MYIFWFPIDYTEQTFQTNIPLCNPSVLVVILFALSLGVSLFFWHLLLQNVY